MGGRERWRAAALAGAWLLALVVACKEPNPDYDGPATTSGTETASASTESNGDESSTSTGSVVTGDGTSSGAPPGTSSGEPTDDSTTGCMGMICAGECVDVMTDPDHCGMCNEKCPGQQVCVDGECMPP